MDSIQVRKSDFELRRIALDIIEGKIYHSEMIPAGAPPSLMGIIFSPILYLRTSNQLDCLGDMGLLYEYRDRAVAWNIGGYPTFTSVQFIFLDDLVKLGVFVKVLLDMRSATEARRGLVDGLLQKMQSAST